MLESRFINSYFVFKILETLSESCFNNLQFFSNKWSSVFRIFFNLVDILWNLSDILHYFILFSHQIFCQIPSILLLLFKVLLSLRFYITNLRINILFKSRNNLFKSTEFRINRLISCCHAFDYDCLNLLKLGSLVIQLCLYCLLTAMDWALDIVNHVLKLFVLLREQSLLVSKWNQILLFCALNNIIHGDKALLNLVHHSFFSLKGHFLIRLDLL